LALQVFIEGFGGLFCVRPLFAAGSEIEGNGKLVKSVLTKIGQEVIFVGGGGGTGGT